jgi:hypothetical protein
MKKDVGKKLTDAIGDGDVPMWALTLPAATSEEHTRSWIEAPYRILRGASILRVMYLS